MTMPMTSSTLRYDGPATSARSELVHLLRQFPQALFTERTVNEYEVSADPATLDRLARCPGWTLAPAH